MLILAVYVDDLFGIEVKQEETRITISEEAYAQCILKEVCLHDCNPTHIPMEPRRKLSKAEVEPEIDPTQYRKVVGCLRYLLQTRSDRAYLVRIIS